MKKGEEGFAFIFAEPNKALLLKQSSPLPFDKGNGCGTRTNALFDSAYGDIHFSKSCG